MMTEFHMAFAHMASSTQLPERRQELVRVEFSHQEQEFYRSVELEAKHQMQVSSHVRCSRVPYRCPILMLIFHLPLNCSALLQMASRVTM